MLGPQHGPDMHRQPRSTLPGPSVMPGPSPMQVSVPAPMPGPLGRDHSPHVPAMPAHMPTMAADVLGLGGHTPPSPQYPQAQLPPLGGGFVNYPQAYSPMPYGQSYSPSPAPPRFQYPNGVMSAAPAGDRRRLLIGILAIAFVAVTAGIVMALVHGRDEDDKEPAVAASSAPTQPATPTATPLPAPTATPLPADPNTPAPPAESGAGPRLASLYGDKPLNAAVFGTDEQFLSDQPAGAILDDGPPPTPPGKSESKSEDKPDKAEKKEKAEKAEKKAADSTAKREKKERVTSSDDDEESDEGDDEGDEKPAGNVSAARRQAASLYKQKQFSEAAAVLRKAGETGDAGKFEQIGSLLTQAEKSSRSDPAKALDAFKKAKRLDEEYGDGTHDGFIGARIGQVAPEAARSHMVYKRYAEAKRAADDAETYGAGDRVKQVRDSLANKAESFYDQANELAQNGKSGEATELARQIMKMVPKTSALYGKASKLIKK